MSITTASVYVKAFTGAMAGLTTREVAGSDPNAGDFTLYAQMANAFATEVDAQWTASGTPTPSCAELDVIEAEATAVWLDRSPLTTAQSTIAANYAGIALAIVNAAQQANAEIIAVGVDPNAACGSSPPASSGMSMSRVAVGTATVSSTNSITAGSYVARVLLTVTIPYSVGATLQVGKTGSAALLMGTTDNNPQLAGQYEIDLDTSWGAAGDILVTVGGAPGAGACTVQVLWGVPLS